MSGHDVPEWPVTIGQNRRSRWTRIPIIALRRALIGDVLLSDEAKQLELAFVESDRPAKRY